MELQQIQIKEIMPFLLYVREQRGITQQELAQRMKCRQCTVSKIENNKIINLGTLEKYATALGIKLCFVVEES